MWSCTKSRRIVRDEEAPNVGYDFNGTNEYLRVEHSDLIYSDDGSITIEAWIKPETHIGLGGIVSKYHEPAVESFSFRLGPTTISNSLEFTIGNVNLTTASGEVTLNQWQHVAATFDRTSSIMNIYVNGELVRTYTNAGTLQLQENTSFLAIGMDYLDGARYFEGEIDDVRIWNYARSEQQIADTMNNELNGDDQGLVAYWKLNEAVSPFVDSTGNGHTAIRIDN
ncbi:LamG domain-containing protein [Gudongella sp. DL1XJH-153]|uniref:LamG domain-containing protein n=1 Tax=Gudongella sp. DL1XJH-153 TaxID=3409804 RepID=UPI003BB7E33D